MARVSVFLKGFVLASVCATIASCNSGNDTPAGPSCPAITGTPWVPNISGAGASNHNSSTSMTQTTVTVSGPVTGFAQPAPASQEVTVTIPVPTDLGAYGSLSLSADVSGVSPDLQVYPLLVYLSDGAGHEFINLARSGASGDCANAGYFTAGGTPNSGCSIAWPSAYYDRPHWEEHWLAAAPPALPVVNTFPTCQGGNPSAPGTVTDPACPFSAGVFGAKLAFGGNYTAKYVLLSGAAPTVSAQTATLSVNVIEKTATVAGGAVDVNVMLVGLNAVQASRSLKGQTNLDAFFGEIQNLYASASVKLGTVRVFEWNCENGGDSYANVSTADLAQLFANGGAVLPASASGALNLFLIDSFSDSSSTLGITGAIGGPLASGTAVSGVAVATLGRLASFNPNCPDAGPCPITSQEAEFAQLGPTVAHEMGHYLGLFHPSEVDHSIHDLVYDTPICTPASGNVTISNCSSDTNLLMGGQSCPQACPGYNPAGGVFCPTIPQCQFNHLMFRTSKYFVEGTGAGDGNMISAQSAAVINTHPLVQ